MNHRRCQNDAQARRHVNREPPKVTKLYTITHVFVVSKPSKEWLIESGFWSSQRLTSLFDQVLSTLTIICFILSHCTGQKMWSNAAAAAWIWHAGSLRVIRDSGWIRHHVQRVVLNWILGVLVFVCIIFQAVWRERMNSICVVVFDRPVSTVQCFWGALCTSCWLVFSGFVYRLTICWSIYGLIAPAKDVIQCSGSCLWHAGSFRSIRGSVWILRIAIWHWSVCCIVSLY